MRYIGITTLLITNQNMNMLGNTVEGSTGIFSLLANRTGLGLNRNKFKNFHLVKLLGCVIYRSIAYDVLVSHIYNIWAQLCYKLTTDVTR